MYHCTLLILHAFNFSLLILNAFNLSVDLKCFQLKSGGLKCFQLKSSVSLDLMLFHCVIHINFKYACVTQIQDQGLYL